MRTRNAAELAKLIEAGGSSCRVVGDAEVLVGPDVVIDSRKASSGALFVALPGEHVDGHEYLPQAAQAGATAAIPPTRWPPPHWSSWSASLPVPTRRSRA